MYVQGLNSPIFIFSIKMRFLLQPFRQKKSFKKSKYSLRNREKVFECGVCLFSEFFFSSAVFTKFIFVLMGALSRVTTQERYIRFRSKLDSH